MLAETLGILRLSTVARSKKEKKWSMEHDELTQEFE